jgi:hypothetical protein
MFLHPTTRSKLFIIDSAYVHYNFLPLSCEDVVELVLIRILGFMTERFLIQVKHNE